jgi:dihydropteroate synthase
MAVLNVTPNSFSDGGKFFDRDEAVKAALRMAGEGADIIDIGGESTRPGSDPVSTNEELGRVMPVITALAGRLPIPISIDTSKTEVAREALKAGAAIINDVMGTPVDKKMAATAAEFGASIVLMHIKGRPKDMQKYPSYKDVMLEIIEALKASMAVCEDQGVDPDNIIVDPGIGFGKTTAHNIEIIRRLGELKVLKRPILVGPSRKSFIGEVLDIKAPAERLMGTAASAAACIINGADIIRAHDVKEMRQVAQMVDRIFKG